MKFVHHETEPDFSGSMEFIAETSAEVVELAKHFRLFDKDDPAELLAYAEAIKAGTYTYHSNPTKRKWHRVTSALDVEFTRPYLELLSRLTGFEGEFPDGDYTSKHPRRLCHTHHTLAFGVEHGHFTFDVVKESGPWNGMTAADYAERCAIDYVAEDVGYRRFEREFLERGNGQIYRNPDYLKRHKAEPAVGAPWLWEILFHWWRDNHATPGQNTILENAICHYSQPWTVRSSGGPCHLVNHSLYVKDPAGTCNYDGNGLMVSVIDWKRFRTA